MKRMIILLGVMAANGLVACGSEEPTEEPATMNSDEAEVRLGSEEPTEEPATVNSGETGVRPGFTRLASIEFDDGRRVVLRSFQPKRVSAFSCLSLVGIDQWTRQCGYAPSERSPARTEPIAPGAIAQLSRTAPLEVYGETSGEVARVALDYAVNGSSGRTAAVLLRVTDPEILVRAGISEPFGYFFAELPPETSKVRAIALDSKGMTIGSAGFGDTRRFPPTAFIAEAAVRAWCCR